MQKFILLLIIPILSLSQVFTIDNDYIEMYNLSTVGNFSENTYVDTTLGKPRIILETGAQDTHAEYSSGSGTTVLRFLYTVANSNISNDLDYLSDSALVLNNAIIRDAAGSPADLSLAVPGAAGSLAANKNLFIDGLSPSITSISSNAWL